MPKIILPKVSLDQEATLREKLFFAAILLCSLFIFSSYLWSPRSDKIKALKQELAGVAMQADTLQKLIDTTQSQIAKQASEPRPEKKTDDRVARILERRVTDPTKEINSVVDKLGSRTFARQIRIINIATGKLSEEKNYTLVPISIEFKGRYGSVESYFQTIENLELPLLIKSFSLEAIRDSQGFLNAKAEVNLFIVKR